MENYYSNSQRWVFDSDGNYLHSKGDNYNPNIQREGYFFTNSELDESEWKRYLLERKEQWLKQYNSKEKNSEKG